MHAAVILKAIENKKSKLFFLQFNDYTAGKKNLLKPYGLTAAMPKADVFVFGIDNTGNLKISEQPKWLKTAGWDKIKETLLPIKKNKSIEKKHLPTAMTILIAAW